jgi:hypothetical protein
VPAQNKKYGDILALLDFEQNSKKNAFFFNLKKYFLIFCRLKKFANIFDLNCLFGRLRKLFCSDYFFFLSKFCFMFFGFIKNVKQKILINPKNKNIEYC